ncbi:MAG: diguanylate cyclase [Gemmatimonadaceae bacterium]
MSDARQGASMGPKTAILFSPGGQALPDSLLAWLETEQLKGVPVASADDLMAIALRGRPRVAVFDARTDSDVVLGACARLKRDSYTGIVPSVVFVSDDDVALVAAFDAGADEAIRPELSAVVVAARLGVLLRRSDRDTLVHPSTRLPGTVDIEADITRRMADGSRFAVCYADLDHFKEFNDRYSYYDGDRVIRVLAKILHDVVKGLCPDDGFVGHIGGDDFIFVIPVEAVNEICAEIVSIFDAFAPCQYSEQDRRAGYFFGKDRRGQLHRVPLMTVSIGVVTNERRHFTQAGQVSELATEMKSYAKTIPGSVYTVDRRQDTLPHPAGTGGRDGSANEGREDTVRRATPPNTVKIK